MFREEARTKSYLIALGWQGGTIHQIAKEFGCNVNDLLYANASDISQNSDYRAGLEHGKNKRQVELGIKDLYFGVLDFWLGIGDSGFYPVVNEMRKDIIIKLKEIASQTQNFNPSTMKWKNVSFYFKSPYIEKTEDWKLNDIAINDWWHHIPDNIIVTVFETVIRRHYKQM